MIGAVGRIGYLGLQGGSRLLYPTYVQDYLDRVTGADVLAGNTQGLERGVTDGLNICLQSMVADGSLGVSGNVLAQAASLVKAGCLMAGARTLSGALTPIAADMPAPTSFNFVSGDYDCKTGLVGDGITKYLDSNRNNNADPQNSFHQSVFVASAPTLDINRYYMGAGQTIAGSSFISIQMGSPSAIRFRNRSSATLTYSGPTFAATGLIGQSRSTSTNFTARALGVNATFTVNSDAPHSGNCLVYALNGNTNVPREYLNARLAYYSIGESLDLALLDARVTALMNTFAAVIP